MRNNGCLYRFRTYAENQIIAGNRKYTAKTAREPHWPQSTRKPSARQSQPRADKSIS